MSSYYDISQYKHENPQSPLMRTLRSIYSDFQLVDDENGKVHEFAFAHYYIVEHDGTEVYMDDGGYGCEVSGTGYRRRGYRRIIRRNGCIQEQFQNIIENKEKGFSELELLTDAVRKIFVEETRRRLGLVVPDNGSKKRSDESSAESDDQQEQMHLKRAIWEAYLERKV